MVLVSMKKNLLIIFIPVLFASAAYGQTISFYKENLVMKLDAVHITVTGEYSFRNNYGVESLQTLFFPIPFATGDLKLDSVSVFDLNLQSYVPNVRKLRAGLFFQLNFHGQEQKKLRIYYVMDHDGKNVRYLLMTHVLYWKKPLAQGTFRLEVTDPSIIIDSCSYKPDEVSSDNATIIQTWRKNNFTPDREFDIWFHHK
jgi:hypothetical protein